MKTISLPNKKTLVIHSKDGILSAMYCQDGDQGADVLSSKQFKTENAAIRWATKMAEFKL